MKFKLAIIIICVFRLTITKSAPWGDYELSDDNQISIKSAVLLATGVLENPDKLSEILDQRCDEYKKAEVIRDRVCTKENKQNVDDILREDQLLTNKWIQESLLNLNNNYPETKDWKERFPRCNDRHRKGLEDVAIFKSWINFIPESAFKSRKLFNQKFTKNFGLEDSIQAEDLKSFKEWCQGKPLIFYNNDIPKRILQNSIKQTNNKKELTQICHDIINDEKSLEEFREDFKKLVFKSDELRFWANDGANLRKSNQNFLDNSINHSFLTAANSYNSIVDPRSIPTELIKKEMATQASTDCSTADLYNFSDENAGYCQCYQSKLQQEYAKVAINQTESDINHINSVIKKMYEEMVNSSNLNEEDKERIRQRTSVPKVRLLDIQGWNGFYQGASDYPPLEPKIYLKPSMIKNFNNPKYRDYLMSTISHELGHHFFASVFEGNFQENLSSSSQQVLKGFTDCVDETTISNEIIPGLKSDLIGPNCNHVTSKRSELAADFFSSMVNKYHLEVIPSWNNEKGNAYLCTIEQELQGELHSDNIRQRGFKTQSHTEPISRIQTSLDPPKCISSLWPEKKQ